MRSLLNSIFILSPKRIGRVGVAITTRLSLAPSYYRAGGGMWRSWEFMGIRVYWYDK